MGRCPHRPCRVFDYARDLCFSVIQSEAKNLMRATCPPLSLHALSAALRCGCALHVVCGLHLSLRRIPLILRATCVAGYALLFDSLSALAARRYFLSGESNQSPLDGRRARVGNPATSFCRGRQRLRSSRRITPKPTALRRLTARKMRHVTLKVSAARFAAAHRWRLRVLVLMCVLVSRVGAISNRPCALSDVSQIV
jgi:hypothetical protein